ncbi:RNA polymerase sigma factor [Zavarzinella formosa]|uniref:RNA polymerase sigma factor n=1 Tax=Zavarzinella formosa TaxID=360055 RepID=UPI0003642FA4|nr:sigma-70 family RNA polymerase sigma factor [Zavarzinella formosa]
MALTAVDRTLLQRCLHHDTGAWNDFVDRFLGLIYHVIHYTAYLRSTGLTPEEVEDIAQEILLQVVANDYSVLRQFHGKSSLAAYLTVIARRICVHQMVKIDPARKPLPKNLQKTDDADNHQPRLGLDSLEEVQRLLKRLPAKEREVVRLFYLEGRTYEEISSRLNIPVNTIGPVLSRAKKKLRESEENETAPAKKAPAKKAPS